MNWKEFSVTVPASTANLGPGFDSIGLALDIYMLVHASPATAWLVEYKDPAYQQIASGTDNLIVTTAQAVADKYGHPLPTAKLMVDTDIPLSRGLGSSASAIAAGIEIADRLIGLQLPMKEKLRIGTELEGHPDNISASLLGGLTISYFDEEDLEIVHVPEVEIGVVILVPPTEFLTVESRNLLPEVLAYKTTIRGSAAGNTMAAALVRGDWKVAGRMMQKDVFHEPYRKDHFPDFDAIQQSCLELDVFGSAISGAGPSLFIAVKKGQEKRVAAQLAAKFPLYECLAIRPSSTGIKIGETVV
ncbi:homoserine kinase [Planococcus antarcticus DSM 14505]|uniref:Homoserine kinase n=1 Tax=Planococcus antarcticus DSM 14505 TaxID=1185653 RepID=A0A1C7DFG0_9BACL|nr:homoserine kinase [Planococcus antarcticus]ANU10280.1 homoserine kinase [Planococcus antarcticus DSM 14505]EIM07190.1 homoserine kinase [Planococcus antarcticus DSM 14505]